MFGVGISGSLCFNILYGSDNIVSFIDNSPYNTKEASSQAVTLFIVSICLYLIPVSLNVLYFYISSIYFLFLFNFRVREGR